MLAAVVPALKRLLARQALLAGGQDGAALAEYTLVLAFVFIVSILAVTALGLVITGFYESILPGFG